MTEETRGGGEGRVGQNKEDNHCQTAQPGENLCSLPAPNSSYLVSDPLRMKQPGFPAEVRSLLEAEESSAKLPDPSPPTILPPSILYSQGMGSCAKEVRRVDAQLLAPPVPMLLLAQPVASLQQEVFSPMS